ncbi:hypothetical protein DGMP_06650 [Desulfomarina profundi]|uniref:Uncharacterized protein n=1 Tax=Desulfomarina profundi TaxID=2772557 RepID=A0A8D5FU77_9BACT|nr:hypothetical protein [Desulfomarina profundi]BCL59972.1 hypothetical protein DGMP_06650 [Desulfomarina profundi]
MITLDTIELPEELYWQDETAWVPVQQPEPARSLDGSLLVEPATMQGGRPITLVGGEDSAWVSYATVKALLAYASVAGKVMTLTLGDGREFDVMFRYHDGGPVSATPLFDSLPLADDDEFILTLRLMEVITS